MPFNRRIRRNLSGSALAVGAIGISASALLAATNPASAAAVLAIAQSAVTCAVTGTSSCVSGTNTSSGIGVYGTSKSGTGVRGNSASNYGLKATSTSNVGVYGASTSGASGVEGTTPSGYGVYGHTPNGGIGLYGTSSSGYGVYGATTTGSGVGVLGYVSGAGFGMEALTSTGYGLYANASGTGTGIYVSTNTGYGVIANTAGNVPLYARNTSGNGSDIQGSYIGLLGRSPTTGFPLVLTDTAGNNLFYVDGAGNVSYKGGLISFARLRNGATVKSFSARTTAPTVEDTGTAQLVRGAASVQLDPTFAASIDGANSYRVLVTPNGDTHGLYVATKTPNGFSVRESQAGRSTVSFDYRIVATAMGQSGQRMAVTAMGSGRTSAEPLATQPKVPTVVTPRQPAALGARP